jgi:membrane-bound lytic murein transglycosylase D
MIRLNRLTIYILLALVTMLVFQLFASLVPGEKQQPSDFPQPVRFDMGVPYGVLAFPIPDTFDFAGERVPLELFDVHERLDRELLVNAYWQSQTMLFFKRANRWFPMIEKILEEESIPTDFKYLALIESGLMNVVSPAGAAGYWQILRTTGQELGLEVNADIDERYNVEKATRAACRYLHTAYRRFGSWTLAAAAYNMGNGGVNKALNTQKVSCYYDLHLNDETSRYVFRILAIKMIFSDPATYGFHFQPQDLYVPLDFHVVSVDTTINDLVQFALSHNTNYKELRLLNPWLRTYRLPNASRRTYHIMIPNRMEDRAEN